jgi:hypothetical protein
MPHQSFGRLWSEYVTAMATCLLESRLGSQDAARRLVSDAFQPRSRACTAYSF